MNDSAVNSARESPTSGTADLKRRVFGFLSGGRLYRRR
jgi:hypothetical protein